MQLKGKKILLGITGSIAAYKSILLLRQLTGAGAEVKVVLTKAASEFVSPLTLSTLAGQPAVSELSDQNEWANHVMLGRWADLMIIAPLSCNTLAKMAHGICDNILLAVYLSATCPVMVCPAMDEDMWLHPVTKSNIGILQAHRVQVLEVGHGSLASGLQGAGRMQEPDQIFKYILQKLTPAQGSQPLKGKMSLVTAGPTFEPIDPVRFIGNQSSGKMGIAIAEALHEAGSEVFLVLGPSTEKVAPGISVIRVTTALEMMNAVDKIRTKMDILVFAAAVADYRPKQVQPDKIKKDPKMTDFLLELVPNPDILAYCGENKLPHQTIIGFALETQNARQHALGKLDKKNADFIVLNSLQDDGAGFGTSTNRVTIFSKKGDEYDLPLQSKHSIARQIVALLNTDEPPSSAHHK